MKRLLLPLFALLFSVSSTSQTFWSNDFSNCDDWVLGNAFDEGLTQYASGINFQCGVNAPSGDAAIAPLESTTAENGFMLIDSDLFGGQSGGVDVENCWFQTAVPISLNGLNGVGLSFQSYYRMWDGGNDDGNEYCLVEVSADGVTWPDVTTYEVNEAAPGTRFELWPTMQTQDPVNNPTEHFFNLTTIASQPGVDQIWLRFRWVGLWGYSWMVDDIQLGEMPENALSILDAFVGDVNNYWEYHAVPLSEALVKPVSMGAIVRNNGSLPQIAQVTVTINNTDYSMQDVIPSGSLDTLWTEEFFLPTEPQLYNVQFSLAEDESPLDNTLFAPIEVTLGSFGQNSNDNLVPRTLNNDAETALGCRYSINTPTTCYGAEFLVSDLSDEGTLCQIFLYEELENIQNNSLLGQSEAFIVTQEMIAASASGEYVFVPLEEPASLEAGSVYFIEIRRFESIDRLYIMSEPEDDDFGMVGFGPFGMGGAVNWFVGFEFTPAIRMRVEDFGCSDLLACNYGAAAICEYPEFNYLDCDGNCVNDINNNNICDEFEIFGCTNETACNYNPNAEAEDGSCLTQSDLKAVAFFDENNNGIRDGSSALEAAVAGIGHLFIQELNIQVFPNDTGMFILQSLPEGSYTIELIPSEGTGYIPSGSLISTVNIPSCETLEFPLFYATIITSAANSNNFWEGATMACIEGFIPYIWINNTGNVPLDGTVTMEFDPMLEIEPMLWSAPIISAQPGIITWEISNLLPGQIIDVAVYIDGPGVDFVGDIFNFQTDIVLTYNGFTVVEQSYDQDVLVSCAYDPNDIQANPIGYTENHFILSDTEIEYKIRFQNTGNAPATDVTIENQIDIARLDISTFQPITSSHNMSTVVDEDGMVRFIFNHIMLPDSTSDLEGSQGFLIYKIRTIPTVEVGEIINNTAAIYFDNNPPIITNTAFHEIYSCDEIPQFDEPLTLCFNGEFSQIITYPHIETITWLVNDQVVSNSLNFTQDAGFGENWNIEMIIENPLCQVTSQWEIEELPIPSNDVFVGVQGDLTAVEGVSWQWYNENGTVVEGATEQTFYTEIPGDYYVVITGENGCSVESELFTVVSIGELNDTRINAYPNPVFDNLQLQVSQSLIGSDYIVMDVTGREVMRGKITSMNNTIDFAAQSSGSYIIKVGNANVRVQK